jgi:hypothetical protein
MPPHDNMRDAYQLQARQALLAGLRQRMIARTVKLAFGYAEGEQQPQLGPGDPAESKFNNPPARQQAATSS